MNAFMNTMSRALVATIAAWIVSFSTPPSNPSTNKPRFTRFQRLLRKELLTNQI